MRRSMVKRCRWAVALPFGWIMIAPPLAASDGKILWEFDTGG